MLRERFVVSCRCLFVPTGEQLFPIPTQRLQLTFEAVTTRASQRNGLGEGNLDDIVFLQKVFGESVSKGREGGENNRQLVGSTAQQLHQCVGLGLEVPMFQNDPSEFACHARTMHAARPGCMVSPVRSPVFDRVGGAPLSSIAAGVAQRDSLDLTALIGLVMAAVTFSPVKRS